MVFSFAPFGYWPIQIVALAVLFQLVHRNNAVRQSALLGLMFGLGWSLSCVHWLYVSMHRFGGLSSWLAVLAVILFSLVLALFPAVAAAAGAYLQKKIRSHQSVSLLLILPGLWTLTEWLRGWVFTGFPWCALGYAHTQSPLSGWAPIIGVFGVGWCVALLAGCLVILVNRRTQFKFGALLITMIILSLGFGLRYVKWTVPHGEKISVRLLQGNVPQKMKFSRGKKAEILRQYHDMIVAQQADLIATPETAIPVFPQQLPDTYLPLLKQYAQKTKTHLLIGIPLADSPEAYANSVIGIAPHIKELQAFSYRYDKHHLVPYGEFVPTGFRWFVNLMHIPLGDFTRGATIQAPFRVKDQHVLPNICYEDLFGQEIAAQIAAAHADKKPAPTILLNLSNIAWFGDTVALPQHLQISQMRALETGRPMLRATNTGMTAHISHKGKVLAQLAPYTQNTLSTSVQGYQGRTPYIRWGNLLTVLLAAASLLSGLLIARRFRNNLTWY